MNRQGKWTRILSMQAVLTILVLIVAVGIGEAEAQTVVALTNPGFEGEYIQYENGPLFVAEGWTPFYRIGDPPHEHSQGPTVRPEYKPLEARCFPYRVADGQRSQCFFAFSNVMDAGIAQRVRVEAGKAYRFSVLAHSWTSRGQDPHKNEGGELYVAIGIDPRGGLSPYEIGVQWSGWQWTTPEYRRFESPIVFAESGTITVYVRGWNKWRVEHNDVYLDSAELVELSFDGGTCPTPVPTVLPTNTAVPTSTAFPTSTPGSGTCPSAAEIDALVRNAISDLTLSSTDVEDVLRGVLEDTTWGVLP